jgi:hypothetical protein
VVLPLTFALPHLLLLLPLLLLLQAMDEFDVFMDAINRRIATQTLLEFAREKGDLQFIFLTPQVRLRAGPAGASACHTYVCVPSMHSLAAGLGLLQPTMLSRHLCNTRLRLPLHEFTKL